LNALFISIEKTSADAMRCIFLNASFFSLVLFTEK